MTLALTQLQDSMLPVLWGSFPLPDASGTPWDELRRAEAAAAAGDHAAVVAAVRPLFAGPLESIAAVRAARLLRHAGQPLDPPRSFGLLMVVPLDDWADVLAVYADGAVRYYNGSSAGPGVILDVPPTPATTALLAAADTALIPAPVQDVDRPVVNLDFPTGVLFRSDGERLGRLDEIPGGNEVLGAGATLLQELTRLER